MAKITSVDGSRTVPGQKDAMDAQKAASKQSSLTVLGQTAAQSVPGQQDQAQDAPSLFDTSKHEDLGPDYNGRRVRLFKSNEVNPYADAQDERYGFDPRFVKIVVLAVCLLLVFFLTVTFPTQVFDIQNHGWYSPAKFLSLYRESIAGFITFVTGGDSFYTLYAWQMVAALLAGAAMGLSGGVYQGALKNALASPSTLGVTQGGTVGIIIYAVFVYQDIDFETNSEYVSYLSTLSPLELIMENYGAFLCGLIGCAVVVFFVVAMAYIAGRGHVSNASLVIAGQVFASLFMVIISGVRYYVIYVLKDDTLQDLLDNSITSTFSGAYTASSVLVFAIPLIICMAGIFIMSPRLNLLAFSDDEARSMGISTNLTRNVMVALSTVMTALVISFVGPVGFVGFIIPHAARSIIGPDLRYLLPATALLGAIMVLIVNCIANMGIPGVVSGSTGTFTSIIGCVFWLIMILRSRRDSRAEWY